MNHILFQVLMLLSCDQATYDELYHIAQFHEITVEQLIEYEFRKMIGKVLVHCEVHKDDPK